MDLRKKLTKERLNAELTNPDFLNDISKVIDVSKEKDLVGRFNIFYSQERDSFFSDPIVYFYNEIDLEQDRLDYNKEGNFNGFKQSILWPNLFRSEYPKNDCSIARVYTLPKDYPEPIIRPFNICELAIQRLFNQKKKQTFRPFGIIAQKFNNEPLRKERQTKIISFDFYSELTNEPYIELIENQGIPNIHQIVNSQIPGSHEGLLTALFKRNKDKTHAFNTTFFEYINNKFIGKIDKSTLDDLFKWD